DYTNVYGASFSEGSLDLASYTSSEPHAFMTLMMRMSMSEKFDVELSLSDDPSQADCVIGPAMPGMEQALDLGEEWFDMAESPLPLALWVMRVDAEIENFQDIVNRACQSGLIERPISEVVPLHADHSPREGAILYRWSESIEEGLLATLNTLYFHQHLAEIPAIKLLGRD
ncbi:MAG: MqnA/MqnD/SBP family protein, partial [Candidatus Kapaibacterium sp.]